MLYHIVMDQTRTLINDVTTDDLYKVLRIRARPKILLTSTYEEALAIFEKYRERFAKKFPNLHLLRKERMALFLYPLSGGFHNPSLCPLFLWPLLRTMERVFQPLNRFLAFRLFLVWEKK